MINVTTHEENALNECPDPQGDKCKVKTMGRRGKSDEKYMYGGDLIRLFSNQTQRPGKDKKT
jgi:hypothetical protein